MRVWGRRCTGKLTALRLCTAFSLPWWTHAVLHITANAVPIHVSVSTLCPMIHWLTHQPMDHWAPWHRHPGIDLPLEAEEGDPLSWSTPYSPPQHLLQLDGYLNLWLPQSSIGIIIMTGTSHLMNGHGLLGFSVLSLPRNEVKYCWCWDFKILWTEGLCQAFPEHPLHTFMCARLVQHPPQLLSSLQGPEHMTVDQLVT